MVSVYSLRIPNTCDFAIAFRCASPVLNNTEGIRSNRAVIHYLSSFDCPVTSDSLCRETIFPSMSLTGDYWVPTNSSLAVNGGVASLIAWLDHSRQKTKVGGKQGHASCRKILLQQSPLQESPGLNLKVMG